VTIPIKVYPATEASDGLSFNQLHQTCQTRVTQRKWCAQCTREVPNAEIIKGFEFEKGRYVVLLEDELDAVKPPSTRVIELVQFDDVAMLHPHFVNRTYYVAPDGPVAADAFVVLREAMTRLMGIGKLAIYGREYLVAVRTHQALLMLHTLHHAAELRPVEAIDDVLLTVRAPIAEVRLARQVIAAYTRPLNLPTSPTPIRPTCAR
jgi:DNA end-binding protein Ku